MKNRGCMNPNCTVHKKKTHIDSKHFYCYECGQELERVCLKCYTPISNSKDKYCAHCRAKINDRKEKIKKSAGEVGAFVAATGTVVLTAGKEVVHNPDKLLEFGKKFIKL